MTDAAVIADSGPAPIDGAPINEAPANFNSPLGSQIPPDAVAKPSEPAKPASLDDSIDRAIAKSNAKQAEAAKAPEPKTETKTEPKEPQARGEGGKFVPKEGETLRSGSKELTGQAAEDAKVAIAASNSTEQPKPSFTASEAPQRFSEDAKKDWATAPESIRRETERAIKELTEGHQKYKAAAERDSSLNDLHEMAKASGKELGSVVREYVNMESQLRENPIAGLDTICQRLGFSLRDVAAHVLNQTPDQNASQQDATIRELRQELSRLKDQVGGVTQTIQQQREQSTLAEINKFASDNPRFEELADDIAFFMKSGRAKDLSEAYQLAERLNPAPAQANEPQAASNAAPPPPVQPDKGLKSINGAPSTGSTPGAKKRAVKSLDEAMDAAFSRMA